MLQLTRDEQDALLALARRSIESAVVRRSGLDSDSLPSALGAKFGAFVTLHRRGDLRGCIGRVEPLDPLAQTVRECAAAAALHDPRFPPVSPDEVPELEIEISVLSPLFEIAPADIEVGRHGLLISLGPRRGLLLPQVALEWNWTAEEFLTQTCRKAGLPGDAWRRGARIQAFTTQVFADHHEAGSPSGAAVDRRTH